jgi:hypothetical protein
MPTTSDKHESHGLSLTTTAKEKMTAEELAATTTTLAK